mgnify:CR=1 FL=1
MHCNFLEGKRTSIMEQVIELFLLTGIIVIFSLSLSPPLLNTEKISGN